MNEEQQDELEVLRSIYADDENFFTQPNESEPVFQFKFGEDGASRSFVLQISWPSDYPSTSNAVVSLDCFYNKHLLSNVKESILRRLRDEAASNAGMAVTFTLVEFVKDNLIDLLSDQPETLTTAHSDSGSDRELNDQTLTAGKQPKAAQMTKAQKRRMWDRGCATESERERGWNWVDIVKHLSQAGSQQKET